MLPLPYRAGNFMNRTIHPARPVRSLALALVFPFAGAAPADVLDSSGYAVDLAAHVSIAGTFTPLLESDVAVDETLNAGPLTQAAAADPPFDETVSGALFAQDYSVPLHEAPELTATGRIVPDTGSGSSLQTVSGVDGGPGERTTTSTASTFGGTITVRLGASEIVHVAHRPPVPLPPVSAIATVSSDGLTLETETTFEAFVSFPVIVSVLGTVQVVPMDFPGGISTVTIPVNAMSALGAAQGSVTLTSNAVSTYNDGVTASVTATTLLAEFDLNVNLFEPGVGFFLGAVDGTLAFNSAHASMTLGPVPEPSGAGLMMTGAVLAASRRRRS